ncbi:rhodanese-like domain-containing protein [Azoarcus sp. KH32C]|uniref:rhodanese-like domain-containing protein n=1 Tax=Azoarcus sp. KH32C TaxID=748247 RepID=UPI0002386C9E|nr:rhodanese-like domain-containing protein [Azoarcus sp. KH32C]BAL24921.1 rhodanese-like protein [Azoarcus sp. KH32C]
MPETFRTWQTADVRSALIEGREIALLDLREEDVHAQSHPLFAANFPLARIELDAWSKLPRRDVPIVLLDDGEGEAETAAARLQALGYTDVGLLAGGLRGWAEGGGELFRDVNAPSKAFGELVEAVRHTPSLSAEEVHALIESGADIRIVDARRYDEYRTMSIPTATSVPGAELALRVPELAPNPDTLVIVNCAGRTRSIIGTQSLRNAGLPNRVAALRNGTIGWTLAGFELDHGQTRRFGEVSESTRRAAAESARALAGRAGVLHAQPDALQVWSAQDDRTTYFFDVRTAEEYEAGHLPGFRHVAGGQLVQETEMVAPVRGARIVLADNDGVRANMTASWLAQMNWEVWVIDGVPESDFVERGPWQPSLPPLPEFPEISHEELAARAGAIDTLVLDFATSAEYLRGHIPGAAFALRSRLPDALAAAPDVRHFVLTSPDGRLARLAAQDLAALRQDARIDVLADGTAAWRAAGRELESGPTRLLSPPLDRYRRPYEGTDNARDAMQGYLDWEFGLVAQLERDGTHGFRVL